MTAQYLVFGFDDYYPSGGPHDFLGVVSSKDVFDPIVWGTKRSPDEWWEEGDNPPYWETVILSCLENDALLLTKAYKLEYHSIKGHFLVREIPPEDSGFGT